MPGKYEITANRPSDELAVRLTALGFRKPETPQFAAGVIRMLDASDKQLTALDTRTGQERAYVAYTMYDHPRGKILYLNSIMIDPDIQGEGLAAPLMTAAFERETPSYLGLKTQSARAYAAISKLLHGELFPSFDGQPTPDEITEVGEYICSVRGGTFPVDRGSYGQTPMYGERPDHPRYPGFYELVDFEAGDALYCVGRVAHKNGPL